MRPISLNDWYRYLESQFIEEPSTKQVQASQEAPPSEPPPAQEAVATTPTHTPSQEQVATPQIATPPQEAVVARPAQESPPSAEPPKHEQGYPSAVQVSIRVPHLLEFLPFWQDEIGVSPPQARTEEPPTREEPPSDGPRLHKRRGRRKRIDPDLVVPPEADEMWAKLPRYLRYLAEWTDDTVTRKYYPARIRESREELIARLTDPVLTLEETARLLGVCPATIRRYTDRGWLRHFRTEGNQRRFRLSDIVAFLEEQALRRPTGNRGSNSPSPENSELMP